MQSECWIFFCRGSSRRQSVLAKDHLVLAPRHAGVKVSGAIRTHGRGSDGAVADEGDILGSSLQEQHESKKGSKEGGRVRHGYYYSLI